VLRKLQSEEEFKSAVSKSEKMVAAAGNSRPGVQSVIRILKAMFEIEKRIDGLSLSRTGAVKLNSCVCCCFLLSLHHLIVSFPVGPARALAYWNA